MIDSNGQFEGHYIGDSDIGFDLAIRYGLMNGLDAGILVNLPFLGMGLDLNKELISLEKFAVSADFFGNADIHNFTNAGLNILCSFEYIDWLDITVFGGLTYLWGGGNQDTQDDNWYLYRTFMPRHALYANPGIVFDAKISRILDNMTNTKTTKTYGLRYIFSFSREITYWHVNGLNQGLMLYGEY